MAFFSLWCTLMYLHDFILDAITLYRNWRYFPCKDYAVWRDLLLTVEGKTARNSRFLRCRMTVHKQKKPRVTVNSFLRREETGSGQCEKHDRKEGKINHMQEDNESKNQESNRP